MPFQSQDILLAFKHIALSDQLNGTEKQFAAFLIDSFNRKTGRCDPSEQTAATILGKSTRTIIRAGNKLVGLKLFVRRKHAGHNLCNSYLPNWQLFRETEIQYKFRRKEHANRFIRSTVSPSECQPCHSPTDRPVTQTSPNNNIKSTFIIDDVNSDAIRQVETERKRLRNEDQIARHRLHGTPPPREVGEAIAEKRWNKALIDRFGTGPTYALIIESFDSVLQAAATSAEMKKRDSGFSYILQELYRRGVRLK